MDNLVQNPSVVTLVNGVPTTTTLIIADGAEIQHKNVLRLVRLHLADIQEFGEVAFETRLNPQGSPTEIALLNEQQTTLLFTYMKNTAPVRGVKKRLVREFYALAHAVQSAPALPRRANGVEIESAVRHYLADKQSATLRELLDALFPGRPLTESGPMAQLVAHAVCALPGWEKRRETQGAVRVYVYRRVEAVAPVLPAPTRSHVLLTLENGAVVESRPLGADSDLVVVPAAVLRALVSQVAVAQLWAESAGEAIGDLEAATGRQWYGRSA